ncbi:TRAP transporter small permease [Metapseudomonas resinovorans]|uniref:TRAP transporter small permease protein n=1 Tax=Metapseudomonas resinovorans NBRC 106553 TaxID=1245471 RepID=S6AT80_METRE|nr:TRAP transporter small permease [Pseudomonas resinovorans]BAN47371.1 putative TRAP dicarboxylate transporter subunit DctQ [Pseudomonas resinovorans NBRC 106553]
MNESLSFADTPAEEAGPAAGLLLRATQAFALGGGLILLALVAMSLVSIIGRKLFATPIQGDIELMEIGAAIAIAAFLPFCELRGQHIKVDAFTLKLPARAKAWLDAFAHLLCLLVALLLAWRTGLQVLESREYGEVSTLLSVPLWLPLLAIVPSLLLLALAAGARTFLCLVREQPQ